jgi:hypothetical protein
MLFLMQTMEGIFDIKLAHRPIIINGYGKDQTDSADFHNQAKGLIKIKTGFLIMVTRRAL